MIIDKDILVKRSKYYKILGYNIEDRYIKIKIEDLPLGSNYILNVQCDYCKKDRTISYKSYNKSLSYNGSYSCSNKCSSFKRKETMINRYNVEHYSKTNEYKERFKKTNLEKYGVEHAMKSNIIKEKLKNKILEKYNVDNVFQIDSIKDKIKRTNLEKYGVDNSMYSTFFKNKINETNLEKYGVKNYMKSEYYHLNTIIGNDINYIKYLDNSLSLFKCDKGHDFEIHKDNYFSRIKNNIPLCTICYPIGDQKSIKEKELLKYIESIYSGEVISSYRDSLEIDIYLPELKIGFEFNGLYWHSEKFKDKNYHLDKTNYFIERGIRIFHIWEDDYDLRLDIVKSRIKNLLKLNTEKIFARKCIIKEVNIGDCKQFLDDNHMLGSVLSIVKLGLYYNDELVSLMTFEIESGSWNLNKFCNKLELNVVGGASKLLSYFIKKYNPTRIISYIYKDSSFGNLYYKLGFTNVGEIGPNYKYIINNHKVNKIYDCGKIKFEIVKK